MLRRFGTTNSDRATSFNRCGKTHALIAKALGIGLILIIIGWNGAQLLAYNSLSFELAVADISISYFLLVPAGVTIHFTLTVRNPSPIDVYIPSIDGTVYLENILIDEFHIPERKVPAGGSSSRSFSITISVEDLPALARVVSAILTEGHARVTIEGDARLRMSLVPVVEIPYYLTVPFSESRTVSL